MDYEPDAMLVSSGPGNPERVGNAIETVQKLKEKLPIFGICLGQQIISLAFGAKIYKMKFGHRGINQPVKDLKTGKVSITSQNHGFTVDPESVKDLPINVTQLNLNDGTPEGIEHVSIETIRKVSQGSPNIRDAMLDGEIDLIINTPSGRQSADDGYHIRRLAVELGIPYVTTLAGARAVLKAIEKVKDGSIDVKSLNEYHVLFMLIW